MAKNRSHRELEDVSRPGDASLVIRKSGTAIEQTWLRWGLEPAHGGNPVINVRSETLKPGHRRCLVPASEFDIYTGGRSPKMRWRVALADEEWFCIAGVWRPSSRDCPETYALVTTAAAPDLTHLKDRHVAVVRRSDWMRWLDGGKAEELLRPLQPGSYRVEKGSDVCSAVEPLRVQKKGRRAIR